MISQKQNIKGKCPEEILTPFNVEATRVNSELHNSFPFYHKRLGQLPTADEASVCLSVSSIYLSIFRWKKIKRVMEKLSQSPPLSGTEGEHILQDLQSHSNPKVRISRTGLFLLCIKVLITAPPCNPVLICSFNVKKNELFEIEVM